MSYWNISIQADGTVENKTILQHNPVRTLYTGGETGTSEYAVIVRGLWRIVPVILLAIGTIGNLVTIAVLLRKNLRVISSNLYLLALTVTDLLILYLGLFRRWLQYSFDIDLRLEMGCGPHIWLLYTCLGYSSWILVAVTLERVISVKFPFYSRNGFSRKTTITVLISIVLIAAAFDSIYLFAYKRSVKYSEYPPMLNSTVKPVCVRETHLSLVIDTWYWLDLAFISLVPFTFLVISNTCIAHELIVHRKERHQSGTNQYHHRPITRLLILLSVMFAITTLPVRLTVCIVPQTSNVWDKDEFKIWWAISNLIMYTNNSINFILYSSFGSLFRRELKSLIKETFAFIQKTIVSTKPNRLSGRYFDNTIYETPVHIHEINHV